MVGIPPTRYDVFLLLSKATFESKKKWHLRVSAVAAFWLVMTWVEHSGASQWLDRKWQVQVAHVFCANRKCFILVGGLEHIFCFVTFHILGISSSQLTNSIIFQRGWDHQPGKCLITCLWSWHVRRLQFPRPEIRSWVQRHGPLQSLQLSIGQWPICYSFEEGCMLLCGAQSGALRSRANLKVVFQCRCCIAIFKLFFWMIWYIQSI